MNDVSTKPTAEPAPFAVAARGTREADEDVVDDIFGVLSRASQAVGQPVHPGGVPIVDQLKRGEVAASKTRHSSALLAWRGLEVSGGLELFCRGARWSHDWFRTGHNMNDEGAGNLTTRRRSSRLRTECP